MEGKDIQQRINKLEALSSELVNRHKLGALLGNQYNGDRDIYQALGYPNKVSIAEIYPRYKRQDIAKAVVNKPIDYTWKGVFDIVEAEDEETIFEKEYHELENKLHLKAKYKRIDKLSSLGKYGILFMGFSDVSNSNELSNPVIPSQGLELLYVKPFSKLNVEIEEYEKNAQDERFGLPKIYKISMTLDNNRKQDILVHHTRIIHVAQELLESEWEGTSILESVYNRLMDLEKLVGSSAEMFWRGGRPGYVGKVDPDFTLTKEVEDDLQAQMDEYEHNLRRFLAMQGVDFEALATQVADPKNHVDIQIQMISAVTGIPKRILTGSERGELASTQDQENWYGMIQVRRNEFAETEIVRPFIDRLIEYGVLTKPADGYTVQWEDLFSASDKDKAEVGKTRATALKEYANSPQAQYIVSPDAFLEYFLGLEKNDIETIMSMLDEYMGTVEEEEELTDEEKELLGEE